jgi:TolB-like protein
MRKGILWLALLLLAGVCFAQNTLVVVPLQNKGGKDLSADVETITELIGNAVARTRRFDVVDRTALEDVMREHKFQMDDWSSDSKSVEMGRVLNANYIVRGQVSRLGNNLIVTARILDVNTARILGTAEMSLRDTNEAFGKMENFVRDLTSVMRHRG